MLTRLARILTLTCWVLSLLLAYQVTDFANASAPLSATATVTVTRWNGAAPTTAVRGELQAFARKNQLTLAQIVPDLTAGRAVRHLFLVAGDPAAGQDWSSRGIGDFGESTRTVVHPLTDAGPRQFIGNWVVFGSPSKATLFVAFLQRHGADATATPQARIPPALPHFTHPVLLVAWVFTLLLVASATAHTVSRARRYAVSRVHGISLWRLLLGELLPVIATWLIAGVAILAAGAGFTLARYRGAGMLYFLWSALVLSAGFLLAVLTATGVALYAIGSVDLLGALKGRTASRTLTVSAYVLRFAAVAAALGLVASALSLGGARAERLRAEDPLRALGDASLVTLGYAYSNEEQDRAGQLVGPWLQRLDAAGRLLVAIQRDGGSPPSPLSGHAVLVVNNAYLAHQPIALSDGSRLTRVTGGPTVVIPAAAWASRDAVRDGLVEDLPGAQAIGLGTAALSRAAPRLTVSTLTVPRVDPSLPGALQSIVTDPVVVAVPGPLPSGYVGAATRGQVLILDPKEAIREVRENPALSRYVMSITPVMEIAQAEAANQDLALRDAAVGAVVALLVVLMAGVTGTLIHTQRSAQRSMVRHLHGRSLVATYPTLITVEAVLLLAILAWFPVQVFQQRRELAPFNDIAPLPGGLPTLSMTHIAASLALIVVTSGGFWLTLSRAHRTIITEGISEA